MIKSYFPFVLLIFLSSCWKKEVPVDRKERVGDTFETIEMGPTYQNVVWYSLSNQSVVKTLKKDEWELIVSKVNGKFYLQLNTALFSQASRTNFTNWNDILDDTQVSYSTDGPSGELDSLCIGDWIIEENIWLLDRGYNAEGVAYPEQKLRCSNFSKNGFTLEYGNLSSIVPNSFFVPIVEGEIGKGICLSEEVVFQVTPPEWDICFTQYIHLFHNPYTPYLVSGVLINDKKHVLCQKSNSEYANLVWESLHDEAWSSKSNAIGYDWKSYDLNTGLYSVFPEMVYVIQSENGRVFKLHFLDFYNEVGLRGYPMFEYIEL